MEKRILAVVIISILIISLVYVLYPQPQEVIIQFKDGTETTVGSLLSVSYKGKEVNSIILKVNEEVSSCCFHVEAESPNGTKNATRLSDDRWFFKPETLLYAETMDRGTYPITIKTQLGEIEFELELTYDLKIVFL